MKFLNEHEFLAFLVRLDDMEDRWRLSSGQQLAFHLRAEGFLDATRPEQEYAELGRMLWRLKEDNSISFVDGAASYPGRTRDPRFLGFSMDDVWKFEHIVIRREGRTAVAAERIAASADVAVEQLIAALAAAADEEHDPEVKSRLRAAADGLAGVGRTVAVETFTAYVRQRAGIP